MLGDELTVMVTGIDDQGKIRLSRQAVLEGWTAEEAQQRDRRGGGRPSGGGQRGGNRSDRRDDRRSGGRQLALIRPAARRQIGHLRTRDIQ